MSVNYFIGVDMAKSTFDACFTDDEVVSKFNNSEQGLNMFFRTIEKQYSLGEETARSAVSIGVESTSYYHLLLCMRATKEGYTVNLINPLVTNKYSQRNIRKTKTDKIDARIIRYCTIQNEGHVFHETPETLQFKHVVRERESLSQLKLRLTLQIQSTNFKSKAIQQKIKTVNTDILACIERKIKEVETTLKQYRKAEQKLLQSIPGIGPLTAATCISEIQNIQRFKKVKQLIAFIGIDPKVHQSGVSIDKQRHITKRGNMLLRKRLYNAVSVAVLYDNEFKTYFQKKRDNGKLYRVALVATMNKMVRVIFAVWKRNTPYVK